MIRDNGPSCFLVQVWSLEKDIRKERMIEERMRVSSLVRYPQLEP